MFKVATHSSAPESLLERLTGDYLPRLNQQSLQDLDRLALQPHHAPVLAQFSRSRAKFESVEDYFRLWRWLTTH